MAAADVLTPRVLERPAIDGLSRIGAIEVQLVLQGAREVVRVSVPRRCGAQVEDALSALGLVAARWRFTIASSPVAAADGYRVGGRRVAREDRLADTETWFVARDREPALLAEASADDDVLLGALLGYPACCVEAFAASRFAHSRGYEAVLPDATGPTAFWLNPMLDVFGWMLISHFPCSARCSSSVELARCAFAALARLYPGFALSTLWHLRSTVLWSAALGVAYARATEVDGPLPHQALDVVAATRGWREHLGGAGTISLSVACKGPVVLSDGRPPLHVQRLFDFTGDST